MTIERAHLNGFVQLHRLGDAEERRSVWRQGMATLSAMVINRIQAVPLEGFDPEVLLEGTRTAMETGLVDDLSWLSPPAAAAALYELAAALPPSDVKRELGRRVLDRLHNGDASTFVALATQLALGSRRALGGAPVRARVALALDLPLGLGSRADTLALALISRRDLQREWLTVPSTGALPARRLAARLLERAARAAAQRAAHGDDSGVRIFETDALRGAWDRLLADRESLVWRHVATARGLLASTVPELGEAMDRHTDPRLTPTEWRRAAASLAAYVAIDPDEALRRCTRLLQSEVVRRDPGVPGAMMLGLPRAAEVHPAEAAQLLDRLVRVGGLPAAEALVALSRERLSDGFGKEAAALAAGELRRELDAGSSEDDGRIALLESVIAELTPEDERAPTLHDALAGALAGFADRDAGEAHRRARRVLDGVEDRLAALEEEGDGNPASRRGSFRTLRELDAVLFETDTLVNLLTLGAREDRPTAELRRLADAFERVTNWMVLREYDPIVERGSVRHFELRMQRLRALLHLVDADGAHVDHRAEMLRNRRLVTTQVLLNRMRNDAESPLRRALCAATSRACDAVVREEMGEISDVLLVASGHVQDPQDLQTLSEASMVPEIESVLRSYAGLQRTVSSAPRSGRGLRQALDALAALAQELPLASSPRVEALRGTLVSLGRALETVASAASLQALAAGTEERLLSPLESSVQALAELTAGARRRLGSDAVPPPTSAGAALKLLDLCIERAMRGDPDGIGEALGSAAEAMQAELPGPVAELVLLTLERIWQLPREAERASPSASFRPSRTRQDPLPPWMPPSRTLGGFYVLRSLGSGSGGSVFVARRLADRHNPAAEQFALKVPEYDGTAARTLSEEQFMQLFREEASALLALPQHPNIARFVTFDAGARPKPILVMELVEGPSLERTVEMGSLDAAGALRVLDGIAAGLESMHTAGLGHLDVKPGNVILREGAAPTDAHRASAPVLVDFGLAGHHIRPGCATAHYGAPEIWSTTDAADPRPADVYALACLAYETLTRRTLFTGPHEMALITAHLHHDGMPEPVASLAREPATRYLADLLAGALRQRPADRITVTQLRRGLSALGPDLVQLGWPLPVPS